LKLSTGVSKVRYKMTRSFSRILTAVLIRTVAKRSLSKHARKAMGVSLLATYHFLSGPIRPYAGGGLSLGITGTRSTETVITTTILQLSGVPPAPTTKVFRSSGSLSSWAPYYLVAGIDGRISHVSIKPEFRYSHSLSTRLSASKYFLNRISSNSSLVFPFSSASRSWGLIAESGKLSKGPRIISSRPSA
jgi:hypothetical protein